MRSGGFSTTVFHLRFRLSSHLFFFYSGFFVTQFLAPISKACRGTQPSDPSFLLEYLEQLPYESDSDGDKQRAKRGKYAAKNGNSAALKQFMVRLFKCKYIKALKAALKY